MGRDLVREQARSVALHVPERKAHFRTEMANSRGFGRRQAVTRPPTCLPAPCNVLGIRRACHPHVPSQSCQLDLVVGVRLELAIVGVRVEVVGQQKGLEAKRPQSLKKRTLGGGRLTLLCPLDVPYLRIPIL